MPHFEHRFVAMGGPCRLRVHADNDALALAAIAAAEQEVRRLEAKYSRYQSDSLTSRINRAAGGGVPVPVDAETAGLLSYADTLWRESAGLFDLTSGVLRRAWDFKSGKLPTQKQLDALLPLVGWERLQCSEDSAYLPDPGMELDFGGCVKEYACDSAASILAVHGVQRALVDLSGDMAATGTESGDEGWPVGIRHPRQQDKAVTRVRLSSGGLASSGDYERCLEIDGRRYGHILHPHTGWPVQGLVAVSVMAAQCLVAGSTATIAMLRPAEEALQWLHSLGLPWLALDQQLVRHGSL